MIITRTPFRIPLGGGGTDIVSYASKYRGFVVSAAIDKYIFITVNKRKLDKLIRASYSHTEIVNSVNELKHPLIREALKLTGIDGGIEITSIGDIPGGTGVGTSGSFTVGLLNALHTLKREHIGAKELAEEACRIEIDILREPIGKHDQYMAAYGGVTALEIDTNGNVSASCLSINEDILEKFEKNTALFYTGITRSASDILSAQNNASEKNEERVINSLHQIKKIGHEIQRTLETGDLNKFGELMDEHWKVKKALSDKISSDKIDQWYMVGRENGALGGKIIGAGGGGFLMFYCPNSNEKERVRKVMLKENLIEMRFRFDFEGSKVLFNL